MKFTEFKSTLKQFLSNSGMSQNELAIKAQVPQSQMCNWANGKGVRYTKNAKKVIDAIENYRKQNDDAYFSISSKLIQNIKRDRCKITLKIPHLVKYTYTKTRSKPCHFPNHLLLTELVKTNSILKSILYLTGTQ